jgi:hypothetical protein
MRRAARSRMTRRKLLGDVLRALLDAAGSTALLATLPRSARAQSGQIQAGPVPLLAGSAPDFPWAELVATARGFVDRESPDSIWPFERANPTALARAERKVFCHYFTPFPLSFDNKPLDDDYYRRQYLERTGEGGKFAHVGGYLRERPLGAGALSGTHWQATDAVIDVLRAQRIGIDGFGVDLQQFVSGRYWDTATALFGAAQASGAGFRILIEPDTDILKSVQPDELVRSLVALGKHPAAYRLPDGRLLLAPFAPEERPVAFWQAVLDELQHSSIPAAFLPVFNNLRAHAQAFAPLCYGMSQWGNRDPESVDADDAADIWRKLKGERSVWMAAIAPQDDQPKTSIFWECANTELFRRCWMKAIRENAQYAHIITWNDYSEATEIEPSSGIQYVFYDLSAYYISWFKLGQAPRVLRDAIYYTHRREIFATGHPPAADDKPLRQLGRGVIRNDVEMVALLNRPATLLIRQGEAVQRLDANAGLTVLRAPARLGRPQFQIVRDGKVVVAKQSDWRIVEHPSAEDPLYVGGSTNRAFVHGGDWHEAQP